MNYRTAISIVYLAILYILGGSALLAAPVAGGATDRSAIPGKRLRLVGTAMSHYPSDSIAVIEIGADGRQRVYHEGDLVEGMHITQILRNRIYVRTNQGEESLTITGSRSSVTRSASIIENNVSTAYGPVPPEARRHDIRHLDRESVASALADSDHADPAESIETVSVYGRSAGVKIATIAPGSIYAEIGLRSSEVIQEVNGEKISRPEDVVAMFRHVADGEAVDIKVKGRRTRYIHLVAD